MKLSTSISLCTIASFLIGSAAAQNMNSRAAELIAGNANEQGSSYRFSNFFSGTDAVVTVDNLTNINMLEVNGPNSRALESMNPKAIENAAWAPVFAGTNGDGLHYADFTVRFYANGTDNTQGPASFTSSFFGTDLSDTSGGFMMEFVQVTGASSMLSAEQIADQLGGDGQHLAAWKFDNTTEYKIRFGWQGTDGPDTGKTFNTLMSTSDNRVSSLGSNEFSSLTAVPEPSTAFLFVLSVFPLAFRRKRQEKI